MFLLINKDRSTPIQLVKRNGTTIFLSPMRKISFKTLEEISNLNNIRGKVQIMEVPDPVSVTKEENLPVLQYTNTEETEVKDVKTSKRKRGGDE